ncbi:DUF3307 domain-containing protein [Aerococcaceae bacterium 50-4]
MISHFLGDYHFQSEALSQAKGDNFLSLAKHLAIHGLLLLMAWLFTWQLDLLPLFLTVWISHIIIDLFKVTIQRKWVFNGKVQAYVYLTDQILHISSIMILSYLLVPRIDQITLFVPIYILKWILLSVLITKPANITFKVLFNQYQNYSGNESETVTVPGAGAMIGNLERILSAIFLSLNALSSIGLIYTAKSIARFKLIEENQGFAEYYLIGTLFSILFVVISYFIIF